MNDSTGTVITFKDLLNNIACTITVGYSSRNKPAIRNIETICRNSFKSLPIYDCFLINQRLILVKFNPVKLDTVYSPMVP